jgi:glycosyltransferase involved in cell wall biosynthesis
MGFAGKNVRIPWGKAGKLLPVDTGGKIRSHLYSNRDDSVVAQSAHYLAQLFQPTPFAVSKFTHFAVQRAVASRLDEKRFDVAVCDFLAASRNFAEKLVIPIVLFQHNVESVLWQRMTTTESNPIKKLAYRLETRKISSYERSALGKFHHVIAVSEHDRQQMLAMDPASAITVVPTGVDTQKYGVVPSASANPPRIVFTGSMDWEPNIDAVIYFV